MSTPITQTIVGIDPPTSYPPIFTYSIPSVPPVQPLPTVSQAVHEIVTPTLQVLLFDILSVVDAAIPNKDQNKAVKKLIHDGFDTAYLDILREAFPSTSYTMGPGHALTPSPDKSNAVLGRKEKE